MNNELIYSIRMSVISANVIRSIEKLENSQQLNERYKSHCNRAIEYLKSAKEEKKQLDNFNLFAGSGFLNYDLALEASISIENYFKEAGAENIADVLTKTQEYLEQAVSNVNMEKTQINWLENFFKSIYFVCLSKLSSPIESGEHVIGLSSI